MRLRSGFSLLPRMLRAAPRVQSIAYRRYFRAAAVGTAVAFAMSSTLLAQGGDEKEEFGLLKSEWTEVRKQLLEFFRGHKDPSKAKLTRKQLEKLTSTLAHEKGVTKEIFNTLDVNQDGTIEYWEMVSCIFFLGGMTDQEKMDFLFTVCDADRNGRVSEAELAQFLSYMFKVRAKLLGAHVLFASLFEPHDTRAVKYHHMPPHELAEQLAKEITKDVFAAADSDKSGDLSVEEFQQWMYHGKHEFSTGSPDMLTKLLQRPTTAQLRAHKKNGKGSPEDAATDAAMAAERAKERKEKREAALSPYERELERLHDELVHFQYWLQATGRKVLVIFEGRDAAGKGGAIQAITEPLNQRGVRVVALGKPTETERTQWYFQRYIHHMPCAGELTVFDRSWYNRAGVERVMHFCTPEQLELFFKQAPDVERMLVESGITIVKYWLSVNPEVEDARLRERNENPVKRWKLSPMDLASRMKWAEYSVAKDDMLEHTDRDVAPWWQVPSDDKKAARLNIIAHFLSLFPEYKDYKLPDALVFEPRPPVKEKPRRAMNVDHVIPQIYGAKGVRKTEEQYDKDLKNLRAQAKDQGKK